MLDDYSIGTVVTYIDSNATVSDPDDMVLVTGPINGEPWITSEQVLVPVWSARDNGREPTTVFVPAENIVGPSDTVFNRVPHAGESEEKGK